MSCIPVLSGPRIILFMSPNSNFYDSEPGAVRGFALQQLSSELSLRVMAWPPCGAQETRVC